MSTLATFQFKQRNIRTDSIDGQLIFCLVDLLEAMATSVNPAKAKLVLEEHFGNRIIVSHPIKDSLGRVQNTWFVFESGATFLISRSRTRAGKDLNRWMHSQFFSKLPLSEVATPAIAEPQDEPRSNSSPQQEITASVLELTYNGKTFGQRESDGYVNVGQMCANNGKQLFDWKRLQNSEAYQMAVSSATGIPVADLLRVSAIQMGGQGSTWGHPLVAIEIARWIDPKFGVWCNLHIKHLIETGVETVAPKLPGNYLDALKALVNAEEEKLTALTFAQQVHQEKLVLERQVEADEPATTLGKAIIKAPNNINIGVFAKSIDMGQNRYFEELRSDGIIQASGTLPYQQYIDRGYFVVTQKIAVNGRTYPLALITPKGQVYLADRHRKFINREAVRDAIECEVVAIV